MDVGVKSARRENLTLACDRLRVNAHHHARRDVRHDVGVPRLADAHDHPVLDAHVRLIDAGVIHDECVGDDGVQRLGRVNPGLLTHALTQGLSSAELALVAVHGAVSLHCQEQIGVAQAHAVARGRAVHRRILASREEQRRCGGGDADGLDVQEASRGDVHHRLDQRVGAVGAAVHDVVPAQHHAVAGDGNQRHGSRLPRLEAHRRTGGNVEPHSEAELAVEGQQRVGLDEVVVAANLDGAIPRVRHRDHHANAAGVKWHIATQGVHAANWAEGESGRCVPDEGRIIRVISRLTLLASRLPGLPDMQIVVEVEVELGRWKLVLRRDRQERAVQRKLEIAVVRAYGVVYGDQLGAVGEGAFDLHLDEHVRHLREHVAAAEHAASDVHKLRHAEVLAFEAVADELEQLRRDERGGLGVVEAQAAGQAPLRKDAGGVQRELVDLSRTQMHLDGQAMRRAAAAVEATAPMTAVRPGARQRAARAKGATRTQRLLK
mmetsp:Transcript_9643/g.23802  ORF Transcript_9643/g.23802 Transcript_9643/m.23802 type:complete len:491 (-) Transcript_9643:545-2017(-)